MLLVYYHYTKYTHTHTHIYIYVCIKYDKIVLLGKKVIISKALIDPYISHDEFVSANNVSRECKEIKEEIKNPETSVEHIILKQWKPIASVVRKILLTKILLLEKLNEID